MTNYNQRLDKILLNYAAKYFQLLRTGAPKELELNIRAEAKQAITSLIKELVAEAKPEMPYEKLKSCPVCGEPQYNHSGDVHFDYGVNQYEENLLKALEEV